MRRMLFLLVIFAGLLAAGPAPAQPAEPRPEELRTLAELLRDPAIQSWLQAQAEAPPTGAPPAATESGAASAHQLMALQLEHIRAFLHELATAAPTLDDELARAWTTLFAETRQHGQVILLLAVFAGLGFGLEWLFWWTTTGFRQRMIATGLESARERLRAVGRRFAYGLGMVLAFALGSIGGFLLFDWPPLLKEVVLAYLLTFLIIRLVLVLGRILLAPGAERFRVIPMATATARFWFVWSTVLVGWFAFVRITLDVLALLGVSRPAGYLIGLVCGVVLVGLSLYVVWRHPARESGEPASRSHRLGAWLVSLYLVVLWLLLFTGSPTPFYVGIILLLLPIALRCANLAVKHVLRPAGSDTAADAAPSLTAVMAERGLRAALLIGGAYLIAWLLGLDLVAMTMRDTMATRLLRGAINALVILLLADFAWRLVRAWIDRRLAEASAHGPAEGDEARRQARLRTLLPILRNVLLVVLVVMAALMALSALGVEIGPLIAGAGVVGVAVGFGAQTVVKDVISGMFYLLDDAFRVGEYIVSGSYKGTVESFSLRSIKLRHHRGSLYTVPFGELGAVQNMSRDWVIDKLSVSVTYNTDLDQVKRIIKQIGKELQADPEFAPHILETLKMQGVEQFGDFAIQIRMKMMTKPGEQFVIRRRAYAMIKKAFSANGVEFAFPTVTVAGGAGAQEAAAQKGLDLVRPPPAA
ncbi:MAG: ybiO2 [Geminicoccaceae bacterium]|nr:ybiO2 [Geminicoccaceae bacterium]